MEKISLLVDTDIFIDYFNTGSFSNILENKLFVIYFSVVTEKELLSKKGLKTSEREAIIYTLKNFRRIRLNDTIARKYSELRKAFPALDKEDLLIAVTALTRKLPIMTRNYKHYRQVKGLTLFTGEKKR